MSGSRSAANAKKRRGISAPPTEKEIVAKPTTSISVTQAISILNQNIADLSSKTGSFIQKLQADIVTIGEHVDVVESSNESLLKNNEQLLQNIAHLTQMTTIQQGEIHNLTTKFNVLQKTVGGQLKTTNKPSSRTSNKSASKNGGNTGSSNSGGLGVIDATEDVMEGDASTLNTVMTTPTFPLGLND
jgi:hypothetical protein